MADRELRLGDTIDDYCTRCRWLQNHAVVSLVGGEPKKVRCLTCNFEHDYRHGKGGRKKRDDVKSLFEQITATMPTFTAPPTVKPSPKRKK